MSSSLSAHERSAIETMIKLNHWCNARPIKTISWQSPRKVFQQHVVFG